MSSSHTTRFRGNSHLKKVDDLVRKYQRIKSPSPALKNILHNSKGFSALVSALRRQVSLVKCRSQDFEDGQITIYDRALLLLSKHGEDPTDCGALELYLTEYLGIVPIGAFSVNKDTIASHIELNDVLNNSSGSAIVPKTSEATHNRNQAEVLIAESDKLKDAIHHKNALDYKARGTKYSLEQDMKEPHPQDRVERMLEVYRQAKEDYFNTKRRDGLHSLRSVRFLRDTAENVLRYLHTNGLSDHSWVPDLERVFAIARDKTAEILGGRKRHFDDDPGRRSRKRGRREVDSYRPFKSGH